MSESVIPLETIESVESTSVKAGSCCAVKSFCSVSFTQTLHQKIIYHPNFHLILIMEISYKLNEVSKLWIKRSFYLYDVTFTFKGTLEWCERKDQNCKFSTKKMTHPTIISRLPIKLIKEYGIKWQVAITFAVASGQGHKTGVTSLSWVQYRKAIITPSNKKRLERTSQISKCPKNLEYYPTFASKRVHLNVE